MWYVNTHCKRAAELANFLTQIKIVPRSSFEDVSFSRSEHDHRNSKSSREWKDDKEMASFHCFSSQSKLKRSDTLHQEFSDDHIFTGSQFCTKTDQVYQKWLLIWNWIGKVRYHELFPFSLSHSKRPMGFTPISQGSSHNSSYVLTSLPIHVTPASVRKSAQTISRRLS
jgi:hypothetical protein